MKEGELKLTPSGPVRFCGASSPSERAARASGIGACGATAPGPGGGQPVWARPQTHAYFVLLTPEPENPAASGGDLGPRSFCSLLRPRNTLPRTGKAVHMSWCTENKFTTWEWRAAVPGLGGARFYPGGRGSRCGQACCDFHVGQCPLLEGENAGTLFWSCSRASRAHPDPLVC